MEKKFFNSIKSAMENRLDSQAVLEANHRGAKNALQYNQEATSLDPIEFPITSYYEEYDISVIFNIDYTINLEEKFVKWLIRWRIVPFKCQNAFLFSCDQKCGADIVGKGKEK
jgi:hypothetical protein